MKIYIGGRPLVVHWVADALVDHDGDGTPLLGQIDIAKHSINIANSGPPAEQERVLLHEVVHGVASIYHVDALFNENGTHNESAVTLLEIGIMEALNSMGIHLPTHRKE